MNEDFKPRSTDRLIETSGWIEKTGLIEYGIK